MNKKGQLKLLLESIAFSATTYGGIYLDGDALPLFWLAIFFFVYVVLYLILYSVLLVLVGLDGHPPANAPALVTPLLLVVLVFSTIFFLLPSSPAYLGWGVVFVIALLFSDDGDKVVLEGK